MDSVRILTLNKTIEWWLQKYMYLKKEYYLKEKEKISRIEQEFKLGEELLSDTAKKELEKYNSEKFEKIKMKVEESKEKKIKDKKLQQNFEEIIVESALKIAKALCINIEIESNDERGIIQFEFEFMIISDKVKNKYIDLIEKCDSVKIFVKDKIINIILEYDFKV